MKYDHMMAAVILTSSDFCRSSGGKQAVINTRLFAAVQMLARLLRQLRVEELTILPLVRLAAETFTVTSLDMLQVAATGKGIFSFWLADHELLAP